MSEVDISGIDKADLLAAIFNRAGGPQGMGVLQAGASPKVMDKASALVAMGHGDDPARLFPEVCEVGMYFDYLYGRCLKVQLGGETMRTDLFNRDHGAYAMEDLVRTLREAQ